MKTRFICSALLASALAFTPLAAAVADNPATVTVDVYGITDFHGHLERVIQKAREPGKPDKVVDPGAVTLACELKKARDTNPNLVLASAGDNIGGSAYTSSILKDVPTLEVLNAVKLDVSAVGNHELDLGIKDLTERVFPLVTFPHLAANLSGSPALDAQGSGGGVFIKEVQGVKVGFVGALTDELPSLVSPSALAGLTISPALAAANAKATALKDGDLANGEADIVVILTHEDAADQATMFNKSVDAVFAGHTHVDFLEVVTGKDGNKIAVIQADHYGWNLGKASISIDPASKTITAVNAESIDLQKSDCLEDAYGVQAIVDKAVAQAKVEGDKPLARIGSDFLRGTNKGTDPGSNRGTESTASNMLADSFASWLTDEVSHPVATRVGVMNPGGVRADLLYAKSGDETTDGVLTLGEAYTVQPFGNEMGYAQLTGAQFRELLGQQFQPGKDRPVLMLGLSKNVEVTLNQKAVRALAEITTADDPQIGELRTAAVESVMVDGKPLTNDAPILVASNSFVLEGGDGYLVFKGVPFVNTGSLDRDVTALYLNKFATDPLVATTQKRQIGVETATSLVNAFTDRLTASVYGATYSNDAEKPVGATIVDVELLGKKIGSATIDTTPVALRPETGTASVSVDIPRTSPTQTCMKDDAATCYPLSIVLRDAAGKEVARRGAEARVADITPSASVTPASVKRGESITINAAGFNGNTDLTFTVHSSPVTAGTARTNAEGSASLAWTIPADFDGGKHRVVVTDAAGHSAEAEFTVTVPDVTITPKDPQKPKDSSTITPSAKDLAMKAPSKGASIAQTGAVLGYAVGAVVLLAAIGLTLIFLRRRQ